MQVMCCYCSQSRSNHLNSCYSWPDIDFRVILRLDQHGSGWVTKRLQPTRQTWVSILFMWSLSLHCGLVISDSLSFWKKCKSYSKSRGKILKHCHQSVIPFLATWKVALIRIIPGFLTEYLCVCMAQGRKLAWSPTHLTHPSLCPLRAECDHCPCSSPNHKVSLPLAHLGMGELRFQTQCLISHQFSLGTRVGHGAGVMASVTWGSGSACYRVPCAHTGLVSDLICEVSHRDTGRTELGHHHTSEPALCLVQSYSEADTVRVRWHCAWTLTFDAVLYSRGYGLCLGARDA